MSRARVAGSALQAVVAGLALFLGVLAVIPAPSYELWAVGVVSGVYGHYFLLVAALGLLPALRRDRFGAACCAVTAAGAVLAAMQGAMILAADPRDVSLATLFFGRHEPEAHAETVVFDPAHELKLDLFRAPAPGPGLPTVVVVHGGAWEGSDRKEFPELNDYLVERGFTVAAIDYRLAPRWHFPAQLDDVETALRYLKEHSQALQLPPTGFALLGRSSGGHLSLLAAYRAPPGSIRGVVALYAPTDLAYAYTHPRNLRVIDGPGLLREFLGQPLEAAPELYARASPVSLVRATVPRTLVIHGEHDDQVAPIQAQRLQDAFATGGHFLRVSLPFTNHAFDYNFAGAASQVATATTEAFLRGLPP